MKRIFVYTLLGVVVTGLGCWFYARELELSSPSVAATAFSLSFP